MNIKKTKGEGVTLNEEVRTELSRIYGQIWDNPTLTATVVLAEALEKRFTAIENAIGGPLKKP